MGHTWVTFIQLTFTRSKSTIETIEKEAKKNSVFCMNWVIKCNWTLSGFSEELGGKANDKFILFSLEIVWYNLLKIIKLKMSVSYM